MAARALSLSPDYARKIAKSAVAVSPEPMEVVQIWHVDTLTRDPPALCLTSYLAKLKAELETKHPAPISQAEPEAKEKNPVQTSTPRTGSIEELEADSQPYGL